MVEIANWQSMGWIQFTDVFFHPYDVKFFFLISCLQLKTWGFTFRRKQTNIQISSQLGKILFPRGNCVCLLSWAVPFSQDVCVCVCVCVCVYASTTALYLVPGQTSFTEVYPPPQPLWKVDWALSPVKPYVSSLKKKSLFPYSSLFVYLSWTLIKMKCS